MPFGSILRRTGRFLTGMESGRYYDWMYAIVNIISILLMGNIALKVLKDYETQKKAGKNPVFKAENVGIKNTDCWK